MSAHTAAAAVLRLLISRRRSPWSQTTCPANDCVSVRRSSSSSSHRPKSRDLTPRYNYGGDDLFDPTPRDDQAHLYPLQTASTLQRYREPPRRYRALVRDFIDDSLYNQNYGYFPTQAEPVDFDFDRKADGQTSIGQAGEGETMGGFPFNEMKNTFEFDLEVAKRYGALRVDLSVPGRGEGRARQVWHTPTELFKPWYARAVARYIIDAHLKSLHGHDELLIYEVGAGNGTLMIGILDYIRAHEPALYARTQYRTIEISNRLADIQIERAERSRHAHLVEVVKQSIFDWPSQRSPETRPCFFLSFEVLDNLAHDIIRYTLRDHRPLQCVVAADRDGDYLEFYQPVTDPLIQRTLALRSATPSHQARPDMPRWLDDSERLRAIRCALPFSANLSEPIWLPTKLITLLDVLRDSFPRHHWVVADFDHLPETVDGKGAPVVQTRYMGQTIAVTTYLVAPGFFDIFFPTDFALLRDLYATIMGDRRSLAISSHHDFLERWSEVERIRVKDGSLPMLDYYGNASFATSVPAAS